MVPGSPLMSCLPDPARFPDPALPPSQRPDRAARTRPASGPAPGAFVLPSRTVVIPAALDQTLADQATPCKPGPWAGAAHDGVAAFGERPGGEAAGRSHPPAALVSSVRAGRFDKADETVLIAVTAVDDARVTAGIVPEQVEVVPDQLHLQQGLVDAHWVGRVEFLPHHDRPVPLHLDGDDIVPAGPGGRLRGRRPVRDRSIAGNTGVVVAPGTGRRARSLGHRLAIGREHRQGAGGTFRRRCRMPVLAPVPRPPQARLQLGERAIQRRVAVVRRRFRADDRAARADGQLDALTPVGLTWVALGGNLDVDPDRLAVQPLDLAQLG